MGLKINLMTIDHPKESNLEDIDTLFEQSTAGLLLVDRKLKVKRINYVIETMVGKPDKAVLHKTIGEALVCIHIGDHADGCGYGSICDNCFLVKSIRQSFKTKNPDQDIIGRLTVGIDGQLQRLPLKITAMPIMFENLWHVLVFVTPEQIP